MLSASRINLTIVLFRLYQILYREHWKMAKRNINKKIEYARRLKELKEKLKPYRNSQTVNLLRLITGSSRVCLNKYWESLESVLTGHYSQRVVTDRIQSVVNEILENGEYSKSKASHSNSRVHNMVSEKFAHFHIDSRARVFDNSRHSDIDSIINVLDNVRLVNGYSGASVFDNSRHSDIDSKANVRHFNIDTRASVCNNVRHSDIDSKANVLDNVRYSNINSRASMFDNSRHRYIDSNANVFGNVRHSDINSTANVTSFNINSNSNVFDNVRNSNINLKANVINRLKHLHINSCNPACYNRL